MENKLLDTGWTTEQCVALYLEPGQNYRNRYDISKAPADKAQMDRANNNLDRCRQ